MLHRLIHPQTIPNSLRAITISIISKLVETIIKNSEALIGCEQIEDALPDLAREIISAYIELLQHCRLLDQLGEGV